MTASFSQGKSSERKKTQRKSTSLNKKDLLSLLEKLKPIKKTAKVSEKLFVPRPRIETVMIPSNVVLPMLGAMNYMIRCMEQIVMDEELFGTTTRRSNDIN